MSIWILRQQLTADEEAHLTTRPYIILPFDHIPDLSSVVNAQELRDILQALDPEAPPESINMKLERIWQQYTSLHMEDVVVVPLTHSKKVAIGEISGRYHYKVDENGKDVHTMGINWHPQLISHLVFGKHKHLFTNNFTMQEVTDKEARIKIMDQLPRSYNRFAKWKWVLMIFLIMQAMVMLFSMLK